MIYVVRYTVAVCDRCRKECDESRQPGTRAEASDKAIARALELGWVNENRYPTRDGRRKPVAGVFVDLVCPECQAKEKD